MTTVSIQFSHGGAFAHNLLIPRNRQNKNKKNKAALSAKWYLDFFFSHLFLFDYRSLEMPK